MTRAAIQRLILALLLPPSLVAAAQAQEVKPPEFVAVRVGFADQYKVGLWTPIEVTLRGGSTPAVGRVRASLSDSDGLECWFEAPERCQVFPGEETKVLLYVRFGHETSTLSLELLEGHTILAAKAINSGQSSPEDRFPDALRPGQRLIVSVGKSPSGVEKAVPRAQGQAAQNVVAAIDSLARLPTRWQGYEGVDIVVISTSKPEVFEKISPQNARIEALQQWIRMGGTLVLCAGSHAEEALHAGSPLTRFAPGHFEKTMLLRQTSGWETYAKSVNPIPPPKPGEKVELPTAKLADVQGKIEVREADVPLVIRNPQGLGQVVFVATDLDRGPIRDWNDRSQLVAAILNLPPNEQVGATDNPVVQSYGYNDLAGQLRSAVDLPRDVRLVPFFVVALLVIIYILLIGPGDYFLLRRLGRGMQWTWITFPIIVVVFAVGAYVAAYWLKGDQLRVSQVDLVDIDAEGTARGASWFSIFSPRGESFDLSMRPRLPDGQSPQQASVSLAWLGKAGNEFNGMYSRDTQNSAPLWSDPYAIASSLDAILGVPIQVWSCKSFTQRWLGRAPDLGLDASLKDDERQLSGTIANRLKGSDPQTKGGIALSRCFLAYDGWAYVIGELRPGESVEIGAATRRISLNTFLSGESLDFAENPAVKSEKGPYNRSSRDMAYVLQAMMFYDAAGGRKWTGMANDYQGFTDLSDLLKAGRAILVAMPPQDGSCRGGDLLRGQVPKPEEPDNRRPLGNALDRHTTIYRFILPVTRTGIDN
ncbi:MAG: hypothetical protein ACLP9L_37455 [Thermoguttaceae bacterium]